MNESQIKFGHNLSAQGRALIGRFIEESVLGVVAAASKATSEADSCGTEAQYLRTLVSVLRDLSDHGWVFTTREKTIVAHPPKAEGGGRDAIRQIQIAQRERQLLKPSVREFVRSMERRRLGPLGWSSIQSLVRDGKELVSSIQNCVNQGQPLVPNAISPYLQVIESTSQRCEFSGLRLMDIWRYFRYTWAMPYNSVPGRSMLVLVRDSSVATHPVIGIAALGSAVVQLSVRDRWIGWTASQLVPKLQQKSSARYGKWLLRQSTRLVAAIYKADLLKNGTLRKSELRNPNENSIEKLRKAAAKAWDAHHAHPDKKDHKSRDYTAEHWKQQANSPLFRAKRCETLAQLLQVQMSFNAAKFRTGSADELKYLLSTSAGRRAFEIVLRISKGQHVGIDMLDITICGAVPPYNPLLGGKLVAMLLCSPEVGKAYQKRYRKTPSIIASSIAGRAVCRPPRLVLLGTTSLYGERLNQYHRISIPAKEVGGKDEIVRYQYLGESVGFGSSHLSRETVEEIERLLAHGRNGRKVNSIFGEGVSPRLRKIRDGLDELGLKPDIILNHGFNRIAYGIALASNFRDVLISIADNPIFVFPQRSPRQVTSLIAEYWCKRWLVQRLIGRPDVLKTIAEYGDSPILSNPAKVTLPDSPSETMPLFA